MMGIPAGVMLKLVPKRAVSHANLQPRSPLLLSSRRLVVRLPSTTVPNGMLSLASSTDKPVQAPEMVVRTCGTPATRALRGSLNGRVRCWGL